MIPYGEKRKDLAHTSWFGVMYAHYIEMKGVCLKSHPLRLSEHRGPYTKGGRIHQFKFSEILKKGKVVPVLN
jgi:hypothetical protein